MSSEVQWGRNRGAGGLSPPTFISFLPLWPWDPWQDDNTRACNRLLECKVASVVFKLLQSPWQMCLNMQNVIDLNSMSCSCLSAPYKISWHRQYHGRQAELHNGNTLTCRQWRNRLGCSLEPWYETMSKFHGKGACQWWPGSDHISASTNTYIIYSRAFL